jgi:hypothetical protein
MVKKSNNMRKKRVVLVKKKAKAPTTTAIGKILRSLGGLGGGVVGGMMGAPNLGSKVGRGLGASMSRFLGQGDYTVTSNSLVSKFRSSGDIPNMHRDGQSVLVRHREYLADVISSTGFVNQVVMPINPGLAGSFPWLSGIAQQYQEYTWKGVVFEFVSTSGDVVASSNTALGSVMMCTQYRATAPAFTSKMQMLNEYFASDAKPSECFCHPIECNPKENPYNVQYIRTGAVPAGEDQKSYDLGTFYLSTDGMQASSVDVGEVWVSYEVELRKPILSSALDLSGQYACYYNNTGCTAGAPFGTIADIIKNYDSIGLTLATNTVTFPVGAIGPFLFTLDFGNTITVSTNNTWISGGTLVNCTYQVRNANSSDFSGYTANGTANSIFLVFIIITNPLLVASVTPAFGTLTGIANTTLRVVQVPPLNTF